MYDILSGMRVVEGSAFVAAPTGGLALAQLGADVIRFDPIGGGIDSKRWPVTGEGVSIYWAGLNKGKRSVTVDLRSPEGRELMAELVTRPGDEGGMFLTNLPPMEPLVHEMLRERRADVITLQITGHRDGRTAVDYTVNAAVGYPFTTGHARRDAPVNNVIPAWDLICGQMAAIGLLAAERHRRASGVGQHVRLALSDVAYATVGNMGHIGEAQVEGTERQPIGNDLYGALGRDFGTADGRRLMMVAITRRQWRGLVDMTGIGEEVARLEASLGVSFDEEGHRFEARDRIFALLEPWFARHTLDEAGAALESKGVLWGPYRSFLEMVRDDPRCSTGNPLFEEIDQPGIGRYLAPGSPLDFGALPRRPVAPAPRLGQHTDEILADLLGLSAARIGELHDRGIVAGPDGR